MKYTEDRMWSAYLDGELSATEAAEFDRALTPGARQRLEGETKLENALGERLRTGPPCPDALWQSIRERTDTLPAARPNRLIRWARLTAVAAMLAVGISLAATWWPSALPGFLQANSLSDNPMNVETAGDGMEDYLREHGIQVGVRPLESLNSLHARRAEAIGAREVVYKGQPVVELVYECCDKPVMVVIAPADSPGAAAIRRAAANHKVTGAIEVGNAVATVVGYHRADYLLGVLTDSRDSV